MKVVVDVCLSPSWVAALTKHGIGATHWTEVGDARATDRQIIEWARKNDHIVFTNDLDFGAILALTHAEGPSVLQVRAQDVMPDHLASTVLQVLETHAEILATGALITVNAAAARVRILPIRRGSTDADDGQG